MTIINDDSRVVNKLETSLTDDARVIIYDRHTLIDTGHRVNYKPRLNITLVTARVS
jgi:hypothetical protein